jgi:hypothetical protein
MSRAKWRPSELEKLELCTAYRGSSIDTSTSAEGTMLHKVMEEMAYNPLRSLEDLTPEHRSLVEYAKDALMDLVGEYPESPAVRTEVSLQLFQRGSVRIKGMADVVIITPDEVCVVDYKFGRLPVTPADGNLQGWAYALGAFRNYGCKRVKVAFIAPHFRETNWHLFDVADMPAIITRIAAVVARCKQEPEPTPHPSACQYCAEKMFCPAVAERALAVSVNFSGIPIPKEYFPGPNTTVEQRNIAQHLAGILADWGEMWKKSNREAVLENGVELPDFALRSRTGARAVIDTGAAWRILQASGCGIDTLLSACKVGVGDLEKALEQEEKGSGRNGLKTTVLEALETAGVMVSNPDMVYLQRKPKAELGNFIRALTNKAIETQTQGTEEHGN